MSCFASFGYQRVWLPMFEYASLLERGHTEIGALRFVEPESGDVVALRSDMTPQIARVISTRYRSAPLPVRLCYQGSVLRRRRERARNASQVVQAGIELVGKAAPDGDLEALVVLCSSVRAAGLDEFVLDIGHAEIASSLIRLADPAQRDGMVEALSAKDAAVLERRAARAGLRGKELKALVALTDLHGGEELWPVAKKALEGTPAAPSLAELEALWREIQALGISPQVIADLGDTWRFDYYTGPMFQILAHGPGEPLASGGRYDRLYDNFGQPRTAAGFALDINNVCWALKHAGRSTPAAPRLVAAANVDVAVLREVRALGVACCQALEQPEEYARAWGYEFVLEAEPLRARRLPTTGGPEGPAQAVTGESASQIAKQIVDFMTKA